MFFKKIPLGISGVALASMSLGNLLAPYHESIRTFFATIAISLIIIYILKLIIDYRNVLEEIKKPIPFTLLPTFTMTLFLITVYLKPFLGFSMVIIWNIAIILNLIIVIKFFMTYIKNYNVENVYPTWFVTGVGWVVASITAPTMNGHSIGIVILALGFINYFVFMFLNLKKIVRLKKLAPAANLTQALFTAPMSLLILGYTSLFDTHNTNFLIFKVTLSLIAYLYVILRIIIPNLYSTFYPTLAAFTFPMVASALAYTRLNYIFFNNSKILANIFVYFTHLAAAFIVIYVLIRYSLNILKEIKKENIDKIGIAIQNSKK